MGFWNNWFLEQEESSEPFYEPTQEEMEGKKDDFVGEPRSYPPKKFTSLQARLFIKTVNDFHGRIDAVFLDMFEIDLIRYAVNTANKAARDNARESEYNRINHAGRYWAIVNYLEERT